MTGSGQDQGRPPASAKRITTAAATRRGDGINRAYPWVQRQRDFGRMPRSSGARDAADRTAGQHLQRAAGLHGFAANRRRKAENRSDGYNKSAHAAASPLWRILVSQDRILQTHIFRVYDIRAEAVHIA